MTAEPIGRNCPAGTPMKHVKNQNRIIYSPIWPIPRAGGPKIRA